MAGSVSRSSPYNTLCSAPDTPSTIRGGPPCSTRSAKICIQTDESNSKTNRREEIQLMEPSGAAREDRDAIEEIHANPSKPTSPDDQK